MDLARTNPAGRKHRADRGIHVAEDIPVRNVLSDEFGQKKQVSEGKGETLLLVSCHGQR